MAKQSQVAALLDQIGSGKLKSNQALILAYIINNRQVTRIDISVALDLLENNVCGRLSELEDMGLITTLEETRFQRGSDQSIYVYVEMTENQRSMAEMRRKDKFNKWVKKGLKEYSRYMSEELKTELKVYCMDQDLPF